MAESGNAVPKSCLPSLEIRSPTAAGGLVPTGETSTATETTDNESPLRLYSAEKTNLRRVQLYTPRTTAVSSRRATGLLLSTAGGSLRQNPCKIGLLIQAVRKLISAPARCWDRGALGCGEVIRAGPAGDELQRFFGGDSLVL